MALSLLLQTIFSKSLIVSITLTAGALLHIGQSVVVFNLVRSFTSPDGPARCHSEPKQVSKSKGGRLGKSGCHGQPVLADLGVTKDQSHIVQTLVDLGRKGLETYAKAGKVTLRRSRIGA